jgi:DNA-binding MarR family transcriptional regulator
LAGPLGTALADRLFALGWVTRTQQRRVVRVTETGREKLPEVLGLAPDWDQPALGRAG